MDYKLNRAWAEIDLNAIAHNVREIRKLTGNRVEMMGVVKADAYGHGVLEVVRTLLDNGVKCIVLRSNSDKEWVLMSNCDPSYFDRLGCRMSRE